MRVWRPARSRRRRSSRWRSARSSPTRRGGTASGCSTPTSSVTPAAARATPATASSRLATRSSRRGRGARTSATARSAPPCPTPRPWRSRSTRTCSSIATSPAAGIAPTCSATRSRRSAPASSAANSTATTPSCSPPTSPPAARAASSPASRTTTPSPRTTSTRPENGGVTITARRASDNRAFTALTWTSGGYSLKLSRGTYAVSGSGAALGGTVNYGNVLIGSKNVKVDFRPAPPPATGSIKGTVFTDLNRDGAPDAGEPVHAGVVVYIDANRNGRRDGNEKYVRTRSDGLYRFADLRAGTYRIRHYVPAGLTVLAPTNGFHDVKVTAGRAVGGRNFADVSTSN